MINPVKPLRFFEIVLRPCEHTYGVAPCEAELGVTGDRKCYNSPRTCQDPIHYSPGDEQIIRFVEPTADIPIEIDAIPCLTDINIRPQKVDPGESIGVRESGTAMMHNFKHNDVTLDPYYAERDFNTYNSGTFWGKWIARWGNIQGVECRTVNGFVGQDIDDMERRYYIIESQNGPDASGKTSFTFKDVLKLLDGDKAQAPQPSQGVLFAAIDDTDTALVLSPTGIGSTYPASGLASMGDEIVTFTRSGDSINLTGRALMGSELDDHEAGETFQVALEYSGLSPADIIYDLISSYTDTPAEYLDLAAWQTEVNTYIGRLYSAMIMRPTPIKTLLNELVQESGLIFFTDLVAKKIALKAMRAFVPTVSLSDSLYLAGSITSTPENDKRISEVWVYHGKRNPLEKQDEKKNYRAVYADITENPIVALENAPAAIREITSRWITVFNQPAAAAIATAMLARYELAPRQVAFKLHPTITLSEGQAVSVTSRIFEDDQGDIAPSFTCQVLQINRELDHLAVLAEEVNFTLIPAGPDRVININEDTYNINLRSVHDSIYSPAESGDSVTVIIAPGIIVGSVSTSLPAFDVGNWPPGITIKIQGGRIQGKGGDGGYGNSTLPTDGGPALYTRYATEIIGPIEIWSGGGGAFGIVVEFPFTDVQFYGGGGAGKDPGFPYATTEQGGRPPEYADWGGDPGQDAGAPAGAAIDGDSYVTITGAPDVRGHLIN